MAKGKSRKIFQDVVQDQFKRYGWPELSRITGVPVSTLGKWGSGRQSPPTKTMSKVLRSLQMDPQMLDMTAGDFHHLWKLKFLSYEALQDRYKEFRADPFEVALLVNITAVMLLRDLSRKGHALKLTTAETGQPEFEPLYPNQLFFDIKLRLLAKPELGLVMYLTGPSGVVTAPALVSLANVERLVEGIRKLKDPL